jgi:Transposase DNA-binding
MGESMPYACQDWVNIKAAYRFFDNEDISEQEILSGHLESTKKRLAETQGRILILHDTTEFSFKRNEAELIGYTRVAGNGKKAYGHFKHHTICGLLMHASLAVTTRGLPVGLTAIKFWT